jgi:WXXGXW repeat (2 copies)
MFQLYVRPLIILNIKIMKKLMILIIAMSSIFGNIKINAQAVGVSIEVAPPELPVYAQPACPTDGYLWSPGYWAYGPDGYYWVPGVWVAPPQEGFLWTPGYWGFVNGGYFWNGGYWGENVGFYGGVCYGYGYGGSGFYGGRWQGGRFQYNTAAWHVGGGIHNTYADRTVIHNNSSRSSFNGHGGVEAQPTAGERSAMAEHHAQPTSAQQSHQQSASTNKNQRASVNHGTPVTTARTTVGGDRYNPAGHSISTIHAANHTTAANHINNPAAAHPSTVSHANVPRPQPQQHSAMQSRPAQPQHNTVQSHPAVQHQNGGMQRQAQPARAQPGGEAHGGGGKR